MIKKQRGTSSTPSAVERAEEVRYLKWNLQKFLAIPGTPQLSVDAKAEIERLANWLGNLGDNRHSPTDASLGLDLLKITGDHFRQALDGLGQQEPSGAVHVTPRERLLKAEFVQVLERIAQVNSMLRLSA